MRILVTGATGFIGSHLCRRLHDSGYDVAAFHRPTSSMILLQDLPIKHVQGDLFDPPSLHAAMKDVEVVYHCAAHVGGWKDPEEMAASHITGTKNVLAAALDSKVKRVIYTSSVAALGVPELETDQETVPLMTEEHTWNYDPKQWPYGYAKHLAEEEVRQYARMGHDAVILNPSAVIGAGDKNLVSSAIVRYMARGWILPVPSGGLNVVHIDDVITGHIDAIESGVCGERYILGGENISIRILLNLISDVVGRSRPRWNISGSTLRRMSAIADLLNRTTGFPIRGHILRMAGQFFYYDTNKARNTFSLPDPQPIRNAIQEAHHWYRANGYL